MINFTLNNHELEVPDGTTILQAARANGITIPTLCDHPDLTPHGGCRLCVVEVEGARVPQAACTLAAANGMKVRTESPALTQQRKTVLELLLTNYYDSGYTPSKDPALNELAHWEQHYDVQLPESLKPKKPRYAVNSDPNPFVWVDLNKCILCTRCVRACAEVQGRFVWGLSDRGFDARITAGADVTMLEARCESCGACVAYCPTGALDNKMSLDAGLPNKKVTTTCTYCGVGCQFDLNVKDNRVIRVTSNPDAPVNGMHLCVKGRYGYDFVHHPDRLTKPMVRRYLLEQDAGSNPTGALRGMQEASGTARNPKSKIQNPKSDWVEVDWDTALNITAKKLAHARDTFGADSVGVLASAKCLNEENYLMNKFARQVIGTNNLDHCARL
jgi:formate dehydrogenase major subunit/formate dehydrogenase alpha subunit